MKKPRARTWTSLGVYCAVAVGLGAATPRLARACGGFFCNQPQSPTDLPVAQVAENVLFAMERDPAGQFKLEAHVQIFYTGPADKFSWVVPVDSAPTLGVGANAVFNALLNATEPFFALAWKTEGTCKAHPYPPMNQGGAAGSGTGGSSSAAADAGASGVSIAFRGDVGPYDATVLRSTSTTDSGPLLDWLASNGYFVSDAGKRLIADYVQLDKYFVAIKLQPQKGIGEIQPLVMRFVGPGPCVPLKLTAVAALQDLRVNLWVLADNRVVPDNYFEIEINPAAIDWFSNGANYATLVKNAANEAGGNAFVTEFAGAPSALKGRLYQEGQYNLPALRTRSTPPDALDEIARQNFPRDAALLQVLRTHIPKPAQLAELDERSFYNSLRTYWLSNPDWFAPFDPNKLVDDLEAKLVGPARSAQALFDKHHKLTRLTTFISPEEMTFDPTFVMNPSLPDVPQQRTATAVMTCGNGRYSECDAPVRLEVPGGQTVWFRPSDPGQACYARANRYDRGQLDEQPAMLYGWKRGNDGDGLLKFDQKEKIATALTAHNRAAMAGPSGSGGAGGMSGAGGRAVTPSSSPACSCRLGARAPAPVGLLPLGMALLALAFVRKRRR